MRSSQKLSILLAVLGAAGSPACKSGVGDPCIPEDEYNVDYSGGEVTDVNTESSSFQCETRVCLSAYFQGRVSCPYGQRAGATGQDACYAPGYTPDPGNPAANELHRVRPEVKPQLTERGPDQAVYCSCRCDGPDKGARYCECPDGYVCQNMFPSLGGSSSGQLVGSYCVKKSAVVQDPGALTSGPRCEKGNCGTDLHPMY